MRSFVDSNNNGLDKVIPNNVLEKAAGFAIFTVVKAGFLVSARAGSGVVIARLPDGGESFSAMKRRANGKVGLHLVLSVWEDLGLVGRWALSTLSSNVRVHHTDN